MDSIFDKHRSSPLTLPVIYVEGEIDDHELSALLRTVYIDAGFTDPDIAEKLFAPAAVRARGTLVTARDPSTQALLGMIILVPPGGAARQIASESEAEVHLLAVSPDARRRGIGRALIEKLIALAFSKGWRNIVLSTQESMHAAQELYSRTGFSRIPSRDWTRAGRRFFAFGLCR